MEFFKSLARKKDGAGPLTGRTVKVQSYLVKVEGVLGEGGFATIYRCSDNTTRAAFALKHFRLSGHPEAAADVHQEVAVMRALRECPYVLHLRAVAFVGPAGAEEEAFMLLDLCRENLVSYLQARQFQLDDHAVLRAFLPVCRAVQAMHSLNPPLAHRDLKAENVLLHTNDQWVLCDFGSSTSQQQVYSNPREIAIEEENIRKHTTPAYRAPEMWDLYAREFIGLKVDTWALGCLLYLLCFGRLPFDGDAKLQILNGRYTMPSSRPEGLRGLIRDMLVVDQNKRLGINEVVRRLEQLAPPDLSRPLPALPTHPASPPSAGTASPPLPSSAGRISQEREVPMPTSAGGRTPLGSAQAAPVAATPPAAGSAASRASGLFWQSQSPSEQQQQEEEEEEGWASFGSPHGNVPAAEPSLSPAPGGTASPASQSMQQGSQAQPGGVSWVGFNGPPSPTRPSPVPVPRPGGPAMPAASASTSPPSSAQTAEPSEGPLSAGFRALVASTSSPFAAKPQSSGRPADRPAAAAASPGSGSPIMGGIAVEPVTFAQASAGALKPGPGPGVQGRGRTSSEAAPASRPGMTFRPGHTLSSGSLPGSPKHSRESSRTVDALSRSSGSAVLNSTTDGHAAASGDEGLSEVEQLQMRAAQLEETCRVLEQLLEEKNEEVAVLRQENVRQGQELRELRAQQREWLQRPREGQAVAAPAAPAPAVTPPPISRSSSMGSAAGGKVAPLKLEVPGEAGGLGSAGSGAWVAFSSGSLGLEEQAPTPTLARPSASKLGQQAQATPASPLELPATTPAASTPGAGMQPQQQAAVPLSASPPGALQKTPLAQHAAGGANGSATTRLGRAGSNGSFTTFTSGDLGPGGSSGGWDRALPFEEFNPLAQQGEAGAPRPLRDSSSRSSARSGFSSVQPSPAKPLVSGPSDRSMGGSPLKSRPSSSLAQSPTVRGHRRQISEPFFSDLNPLG